MQKYSAVITIERFLVQNFANYRTMAEISTAKTSLPKSPTELEKDGPSFSSLFSLASACATVFLCILPRKIFSFLPSLCLLKLLIALSLSSNSIFFSRFLYDKNRLHSSFLNSIERFIFFNSHLVNGPDFQAHYLNIYILLLRPHCLR